MCLEARRRGVLNRDEELIDIYCRQTGRPGVSNWPFYIAYCKFRLAAISQGVYKRGLDGIASSERAAEYGAVVRDRAVQAWQLVEA